MTPDLAARVRADFRKTRSDLWADPPYHVDSLNGDLKDRIAAEFFARTRPPDANPLGLMLLGAAGSGKTHFLGALRRRVVEGGGWFVRIDLFEGADFGRAAAQGFAKSLARRWTPRSTQAGAVLLAALKTLSADPVAMRAAAEARSRLKTPTAVELLLAMLAAREPTEAQRFPDIVRALSLLESPDPALGAAAHLWLRGDEPDGPPPREPIFSNAPPAPIAILRGLLRVMALGGPTCIAVDGIDARVAETAGEGEARRGGIAGIAEGLRDLHDAKRRALTLVACREPTWSRLRSSPGVRDRFRALPPLPPIPSAEVAERLIAARLAPAYAQAGFAPPYPSYPFPRAAMASAEGARPRALLRRCGDDIDGYLRTDAARESAPSAPAQASPSDVGALDEAFARALQAPGLDAAAIPALLAAACELYLRHLTLPREIEAEAFSDAAARNPALHARIAIFLDDDGGRQLSFGFHAIAENDAAALRSRLKAAMTEAGLDSGASGRKLVILSARPPSDPLLALEAGGAQILAPAAADFAVIAALRRLEPRPGFDAWLRLRKPLFETELFRAAGLAPPLFLEADLPTADLPTADLPPADLPTADLPTADVSVPPPGVRAAPEPGEIFVGRAAQIGALVGPLTLSTTLLPRHIAVFGDPAKGAFLSRIVEEAAILGAPAVVLDVDNQFARLGEPWPSRPTEFSDEDARKAKLFFDQVEVIVWTPGVSDGRSFTLPLLPDFAAFGPGSDPASREGRERAVEMAMATLDPYLPARGAKAIQLRGALADGLRAFGRAGGGSLDDLLRLLSDLPSTASRNADAPALAREIVVELAAAIATDPFSTERGPHFDPAQLFLGDTRKTRVSVVNLSGLTTEAARAGFVNQLQMTLYFWIRRHPSPTARLYAMGEAHRFLPATQTTPAKRSARALSQQAQTSGLSMIFATERPRELDPAIVSNCLTHVYGRVGAPADVAAVVRMMAAKGGAADDVSGLRTGEFYYATEGFARPIKIRSPLSLSRRTQTPPTMAEVAAIARRRGDILPHAAPQSQR